MGNQENDRGTAPTGAVPRVCSKCKINERRGNSSWCKSCLSEKAAEYRARMRPRRVREERVCALEGCERIFTWDSAYPKQLCCCKSHYGKYRWRLAHPPTEREVLEAGQKRCGKCKIIKSELDFAPSMRKRSGSHCRECARAYDKRWSSENRDKTSAATRRSRQARLLRLYQAPSDNFYELLAAQGGACASCGGPSGQREFHIDHDHKTKVYRGIVCHGCNVGIGAFGDSIERLEAAIRYLKSAKTP